MFREAAQAPARVAAQLVENRPAIAELAAALRATPPRAVVTCARGSSDHAATFAKYLVETRVGVLTASAAPSISSVYAARPDFAGALFIAISQSGASPDLLATAEDARRAGARVVAFVNAQDSPLAGIAHHVVPLRAGPETSVAATKSFIASLAAIAHLVAEWTDDGGLRHALALASGQLAAAWQLDWSEAVKQLAPVQSAYVVGRGLGLGVAQESALKLKETCGLHAEGLSAAELRHGPMALVNVGFPVLVFSQDDETRTGIDALVADLALRGANTLVAGGRSASSRALPTIEAHPVIEPMLIAQSFYRMVNALAIARGRDPDRPPNLRKITETV
jgi:glutamine---fructose-6-phosphate transaminase (isomerizing)